MRANWIAEIERTVCRRRIQLDTKYKLSEGTRAVYEDRDGIAPPAFYGDLRELAAQSIDLPTVYVCICVSRLLFTWVRRVMLHVKKSTLYHGLFNNTANSMLSLFMLR